MSRLHKTAQFSRVRLAYGRDPLFGDVPIDENKQATPAHQEVLELEMDTVDPFDTRKALGQELNSSFWVSLGGSRPVSQSGEWPNQLHLDGKVL